MDPNSKQVEKHLKKEYCELALLQPNNPEVLAVKTIYAQKKVETECAVKAYEFEHGPGSGGKKRKYIEPVLHMTRMRRYDSAGATLRRSRSVRGRC